MKSKSIFLTLLIATLAVLPAAAQQNKNAKGNMTQPAAPKSDLEAKIEGRLGKALTADQKQRLDRQLIEYTRTVLAPHAKFIQDVAKSVNQTDDVVAPMVPRSSSPSESIDKAVVAKLEAKLARKLTPAEQARIKALDDGRKALIKVLQDNHAKQVAAIVGLPANIISEMLPK